MPARVAEHVLFDDELSQEIDREVDSTLQRVAELCFRSQLESEPLSCDMYEALNNVRIMPRASHKDTGKRRVNQVNENSKLKSEIYLDAKAICTEERVSARPDRVQARSKNMRFSRRLSTLVTI